jgi:16S rRNA (guanine527-N7)-methyltransferase
MRPRRGLQRLRLRRFAALARATSSQAYIALLAKWNATYNLTGDSRAGTMVTHHVLDALAVLPHLPARPDSRLRVLDVGSGGGVPAIPLAIARPTMARRALDSNTRRARSCSRRSRVPLPNAEA